MNAPASPDPPALPEAPGRRRAGPALLLAAIGGAGTMSVELAAVRLLAPWFGSSLSVWTNVIGVILLALAVGYLMGGLFSMGPKPLARAGAVLALAALFTVALPSWTPWVCERFLPAELALHEAAGVLVWGSLAAASLLFLPPALLLGSVGPLVVEGVCRRTGAGAGVAGGQVLAWSTLGSLVGTFATTHVAVPGLGLQNTFLVAGGLLALAAILAFLLERPGRGGAGVVLLAALAGGALCAAPGYRGPALRDGWVELERGESPYQSVRVVEIPATPEIPGGRTQRHLQVNEGWDSFQSVWIPEPGLLGEGHYYDDFALPLLWRSASETPERWRALVLGLGAGTAFRVLEGIAPAGCELDLVGVEIDPLVVELGRRHMDLAPEGTPGRRVLADLDARAALRALEPGFDQIVVDAYAHQVEIPPHLASLEFFREVRAALTPGGWMVVNVGAFGFRDPVLEAIAVTAAAAFGQEVLVLRVPLARNFTVLARRDAPLPRPGEEGWALEPEWHALLLATRELQGRARFVSEDGAQPLTDDWAPLERLQARSIREAQERLGS